MGKRIHNRWGGSVRNRRPAKSTGTLKMVLVTSKSRAGVLHQKGVWVRDGQPEAGFNRAFRRRVAHYDARKVQKEKATAAEIQRDMLKKQKRLRIRARHDAAHERALARKKKRLVYQ